MNETTRQLLMLISMGAGVIALIVIYQVSIHLIAFLLEKADHLIRFLVHHITGFLEMVLTDFGQLVITTAKILPRLVWKATELPARFINLYISRWLYWWQEQYKLWELYLEYGVNDFKSFAQFKRYMRGEEEPRKEEDEVEDNDPEPEEKPEAEPTPKPAKSSYEKALDVFGLSQGQVFSKAELKNRYRKLMSKYHPDKGCDTDKQAQNINVAYDLIKKRRKWK